MKRFPKYKVRTVAVGISGFLIGCCALAQAQDVAPERKEPPLPIYPAKPKDCYVLLKNQWPRVQGGDYPVCRAMLDNLNKFCDEPPQYDRRKLHPTTKNLSEPNWVALDPRENAEAVKQTVLAKSPKGYRDQRWQQYRPQVATLVENNALHLWRAQISVKKLGEQIVFRLDGMQQMSGSNPPRYQQPSLMFAEGPKPAPSPLFELVYPLTGDLWRFRDDWFLVNSSKLHGWFTVRELRPRAGADAPVVASIVCTIQHTNDRK